jgi:molybdopterin-containing oxidoreductase family iron-sulfur binding subunit
MEKNGPVSKVSRRTAITGIAGLALAIGAAKVGADRLKDVLGKRFHEMTPDEIDALIARIEKDCRDKYGKDVHVSNDKPIPGVEFAYGLDLSRCVGCRRCAYACAKENNLSRQPQIHWIRVLEMDKERGVDVFESNIYYDRKEVPEQNHTYMPVACHQCRNPPCVKACPVKATWQEEDGIVVIDPEWCIGCRCCMAACPYGARHFNWAAPSIPKDELNTEMHPLGNRPRPRGVVEKCTFCIQRTRKGLYPACVEICPVGARKFGNLNDPDSEMRYILKNKRVYILKEEVNTRPRFYYFYAT